MNPSATPENYTTLTDVTHPDSRQWVFLEPGIIQYDSRTTDHDHYMKKNAQIVVLPDGQLQRHWFAGRSSKETNGSIWGKVCN
jgi:hypothetical protein